jgi:hypothetical protein
MTLHIALDTCALVSIDKGDDETVLRRTHLLSLLYQGLTSKQILLLIDVDRKIHAEYERHLRADSMGRRLLTVAFRHSAVMYGSGNPNSKCAYALKQDGFDPADVVFVAIAQHMSGVYVTTEQKHLMTSRKEVVSTNCGVSIMSLDDFHETLIVV